MSDEAPPHTLFAVARDLKHSFDLVRAAVRDRIDPDPVGMTLKVTCNQAQRFESALRRSGRSLCDFEAILDFGCGDGRFLDFMTARVQAKKLLGCDVLTSRVAHCGQRFPAAKVFACQPTPPLDLEDGAVDFIFSYSVFTHLSEENHLNWLQELARVLKPDGCMLHTFKSGAAAWRYRQFSTEFLTKYSLSPSAERQLLNPDVPSYFYTIDNPNTPEYGLALMNRAYILSRWPRASGMKVEFVDEEAIEAYPEGVQGLVLLSKSSSP
jgi:SAM-dependent methyltransferase